MNVNAMKALALVRGVATVNKNVKNELDKVVSNLNDLPADQQEAIRQAHEALRQFTEAASKVLL
jgi:hypothetical protein